MNQKHSPETVLITGASSGIGLELARIFAQHGFKLVLVARNRTKLLEIAATLPGSSVHVIAKDLSHPRAPQEVFEELREKSIPIDVLVNNAGFGQYGKFADTDLETQVEMIELNIVALAALTRLFLPDMLERGTGKIMNVASTAAFQAGPLMAVYYASKAFVLSFSEAIENELHGTGITVSCLCPGATETNFADRAGMKDTWLFKLGAMDAKTVAEAGYAGLMKGKSLVIPGAKNKLLVQSERLAPRKLVTAISRKIQEQR